MDKQPLVLCVDDEPGLLDVIEGQLISENYDLRRFNNGEELLEDQVALAACDLILLDVQMPGISGFELIKQIRGKNSRFLPIVLITALGSTEHKVMGLDAGATDFITKPTVGAELRARVRAHLRAKQLHDENSRLTQTKDKLTKMIVHDLKNPLTSVTMALDMMGDPPDFSEVGAELWGAIRSQVKFGLELCEEMLDITRMEQQTLNIQEEQGSLRQTVGQAIASVAAQAKSRNVEIVNNVPEFNVGTDHNLLRRILLNLLNNAVKYTRPNNSVIITGRKECGAASFCVDDYGPGIPEEYHNQIFELYGSAEIRQEARGAGLGLAFCKMAVEALGGTISVENLPERGSRFCINLPQST